MKIAHIYTEYQSISLDRPWSYFIDDNINVVKGTRVNINFNNRNIVGYVEDITISNLSREEYEKEVGFPLKDIDGIIDSSPLLTDELVDVAHYLAKSTITNLITCYQAILPPSLKPNSSKKVNIKTAKYVRVINDINDIKLTLKQLETYNLIKENDQQVSDVSPSILNKLISLNLVEKYDKEIFRDPLKNKIYNKSNDLVFTPEQARAFSEIYNSNDKIFLLEGVTGSGKTEIYMRLAKEELKKGRNVLVLIPEITLTPLMIKRFKERFDYPMAIFHSKLSNGEKYDEYRRIKSGEVRVVIGARSAIFAPLENIGLIIIDEEHSDAYKQDNSPSYHMIDIAKFRANYNNAKIILGSATPSIESKTNAINGYYHQIYLKKRINDISLPKVEIVDLNNELRNGNSSLISNKLRNRINDALKINHQAILLLNRRGYAVNLKCIKCGNSFNCPTCNIPMHYHKTDNTLKCHYCGKTIPKPLNCPICGSKYIRHIGSGTEKLESEVKNLFKDARVARLDFDTALKKNNLDNILEDFGNHKYDILIGTQIISKGLDFEDIDVVGIINADSSLFMSDFRSNEKSFQLFTQVIGRCGRKNKVGNAIIQTYSPNNKIINLAAYQDYETFYKEEIKYRKLMNYPPFSYIASITILNKNKEKCYKEINLVKDYILNNNLDSSLNILGPSMPFIKIIEGTYRYRIILKYRNKEKIYELLNKTKEYSLVNKIDIRFDTNPYQNI